MTKLWLLGLTASAALTAPAGAQTISDPGGSFGIEGARLQLPAAAAAAAMDDPAMMRGMRDGRRHGGPRPGHHRWSRINRGGFVPSFWFGPQFVIGDWRMFGFSRPMRGTRWIRYYDDALLIDSYGRVHDGRWGHDWDRYPDRWAYRDGIPVYVGRGDYEPDRRDYARSHRRDRSGPPPMADCYEPCGPAQPAPAYGYGGYGGYGYGCGCGGVVITETTTTTAPVVETRTYYEYVTEEVPAPRRAYRKPVRRTSVKRAPAPPRPGERG